MAEGHPHEHDLLAYVEEELPRDERDTVSLHLETCEKCRAAVADARTGRSLVRAAPLLELAPARHERIVAALEPPGRRPSWRLVAVLAAALLLGAAVAIGAFTRGDSGEERPGAAAADTQAGRGEASGAPAPTAPGRELLARVAGPPGAVLRTLRGRGADARIENGAVIVSIAGLDPADVDQLVAGLDPGPVEVYAEGP